MVLVISLQMNISWQSIEMNRRCNRQEQLRFVLYVINVIIPTQLNISLDIGVYIAFHLNIYVLNLFPAPAICLLQVLSN